jgi:hypothetical protein
MDLLLLFRLFKQRYDTWEVRDIVRTLRQGSCCHVHSICTDLHLSPT